MLSVKELRSSTVKELNLELEKARKEKLAIAIGVKTKHEKNASKVGKQKRYIAQILTVMKEVEKEEVAKASKKEVAKAEKPANEEK